MDATYGINVTPSCVACVKPVKPGKVECDTESIVETTYLSDPSAEQIQDHKRKIRAVVNVILDAGLKETGKETFIVCSDVYVKKRQKLGATLASSTASASEKMTLTYGIEITWRDVLSKEHITREILPSMKQPFETHLSKHLEGSAHVKAHAIKGGAKAGGWWSWARWVLVATGAAGTLIATTLFVTWKCRAPEQESADVLEHDLIQPNHWKRADNVPLIGSGTFGIVYLSQNTLNGKQFCAKEVDLRRVIPEEGRGSSHDDSILDEQEARIRHEIQLLAMYRHPRIVSYLGCEVSGSQRKLFIFMEYLAGGTLKDNLKRYGHMDPRLVQMYARDIMEGLKFLHTSEVPVIHRDIKPANILLSLEGRCKLADFGCIEIIDRGEHSRFIAGTRLYAPPEMIDTNKPATPTFDVWSLAVTLHKMLTNVHLWPPQYVARPRQLIEFQRKVLADPSLLSLDNALLGEQEADLISSMLVAADHRPTIADLEKHPFFQQEWTDPSEEIERASESEKRKAALDKLTQIRNGRAVSVTVKPGARTGSSASASLFDINVSTRRRGRLRPEDRPRLEDIQDDGYRALHSDYVSLKVLSDTAEIESRTCTIEPSIPQRTKRDERLQNKSNS